MATRSLNKVLLIGNLTRDPELRYTPQGTAVCTMGLATNRTWVVENGEKREETEWHRIVAWNKLAELCSQLLFKGRRIYVEGRLQTRQWTGQDGSQRQATEIVIEDMIVLDSKRQGEDNTTSDEQPVVSAEQPIEVKDQASAAQVADDIPF
jgi:single-strand DNA-binding protein